MRIGYLDTSNSALTYGGIAEFIIRYKQICDNLGWKFDIIVNKPPSNSQKNKVKYFEDSILYPNNIIYGKQYISRGIFVDHPQAYVDIFYALEEQLRNKIYDLLITGKSELILFLSSFNLIGEIPMVLYVHVEQVIYDTPPKGSIFYYPTYLKILRGLHQSSNIPLWGSNMNFAKAIQNQLSNVTSVDIVPVPLRNDIALKPLPFDKTKDILYAGSGEIRKRGLYALEIVKKLPGIEFKFAIGRGIKSIQKKIKDDNITNCEILEKLNDEEYYKIHRTTRLGINTSLMESFGINVLDHIMYHPCLLYYTGVEKYVNLFKNCCPTFGNIDEAVSMIKDYYYNEDKWHRNEQLRQKFLAYYQFDNVKHIFREQVNKAIERFDKTTNSKWVDLVDSNPISVSQLLKKLNWNDVWSSQVLFSTYRNIGMYKYDTHSKSYLSTQNDFTSIKETKEWF